MGVPAQLRPLSLGGQDGRLLRLLRRHRGQAGCQEILVVVEDVHHHLGVGRGGGDEPEQRHPDGDIVDEQQQCDAHFALG